MSAKTLLERLEQRLALLLEETKRRVDAEVIPTASLPAIATALEQRVIALVSRLVEPEIQRAVLDRAELASRWDLADADEDRLSPRDAGLLRHLIETERNRDPPSQPAQHYWPPAVAPAEVASALERTRDPDAFELAAALRQGWLSPANRDSVLRSTDSTAQANSTPPPQQRRGGGAGPCASQRRPAPTCNNGCGSGPSWIAPASSTSSSGFRRIASGRPWPSTRARNIMP